MSVFGRRPRLQQRDVVVPTLVIGSLVVAVVAGVAAGVERPYPDYALRSGLLLVIERAVAIWVAALLVLIVGDQALRGRLPIEISGRGVRYAEQKQLDEVAIGTAQAGADVSSRLDALEAKFLESQQGAEGS